MEFAAKVEWDKYKFLSRVNSWSVMDAMDLEEVDYGVIAIVNINAGLVEEISTTLKGRDNIEFILSFWVLIHHCIFIKEGYEGPVNYITSLSKLCSRPGAIWRGFHPIRTGSKSKTLT